ncbi:hypothetical protein C0989_008587 [Termitomyces sp. Mn162]|nr:hypothetical protein C0989_008587 [Termitomyces sp. Mn162]
MAPPFLTNLVPRKEQRAQARPLLEVLLSLTWVQWALFFSGWLAWSCDAIDFFSVSLVLTRLRDQFKESTHTITTAITLTLLFRSVGAVIFGILSDRFGRKWPMVANLVIVAILQLGGGFVNTFSQFLACRSLFGIGMGGIWGLAASTALENLPVEARGLASGVLQQGYAVGYLFAACMNLRLVPETAPTWRSLFWTGAGISLFAAIIRALLPESEVFLRAKAIEKSKGTTTGKKTRVFLKESGEMLKRHWILCIYAVLLMTGFNFLSHGSQDLYPTYLQQSKGLSANDATVATIIGNCGAIASLAAGAFCIQFGVQGAWGVIPIQLSEMSPPAFRATFPGVAYQLGNMVSSAASQIEATGGDNLRTTIMVNGQLMNVPDYATVQGILIGVVAAFVLVITIIGPEKHGAHFEKHKVAFEEGGGCDDALFDDEVPQETREHWSSDDKVRPSDEKL